MVPTVPVRSGLQRVQRLSGRRVRDQAVRPRPERRESSRTSSAPSIRGADHRDAQMFRRIAIA